MNHLFIYSQLKLFGMNKNCIALFFFALFTVMLSAPSIIAGLDESADISIFYSMSEEEEKEEKQGEEKKTIDEVFYSEINPFKSSMYFNDSRITLGYFNKKYARPHLNLISPPPELF